MHQTLVIMVDYPRAGRRIAKQICRIFSFLLSQQCVCVYVCGGDIYVIDNKGSAIKDKIKFQKKTIVVLSTGIP